MQAARWFAGKGRSIASIDEVDAFALDRAGDGARVLAIADVAYADGGRERYLMAEALAGSWAALLGALREGPLHGAHGRLELRPGPALDRLSGELEGEAVPAADQSNTLVGLGGRLLIKAYRLLQAGPHPEVELCAALDGTGAPVPAFAGSIHHVAADGSDTAIALLQELVPEAEAGWEAPILRAAAVLRGGGAPDAAAVGEYRAAGAAVARLHAALVAVSPPRVADDAVAAGWHAAALAALDAAAAVDPVAAGRRDAIAARLAPLRRAAGTPMTRVHGDLHVAQLLRSPGGLRVIDFEGDPTRPLAERRRPDTPLRDLACLLRSVEHVGWAAARRVADPPDPEAWIRAATAATLAGYGAAPDRELLAALELAKSCQELIYAHRVVPEWAYAPRAGLEALLRRLEDADGP
ncbi:MAG TPA: phosphotransferase [Capillimicrobium sp.]|nr:phosphotransferase [Capillimicrobium sp.]